MTLFAGIEHVALAARDPKSLAEFYSRALGFKTRITFDNGPQKPKTYMIALNNAEPYIELIPAADKALNEKDNNDPGLSHLAITVGDFDAAAAHLAKLDVRKEGEERKAPFGARVQFYRDPEGNLFHILFPARAASDAQRGQRMTAISFRDACAADLPRIVAIYNASIPGRLATGDLEPVSVESRQAWFAAHSPEKYPLIVAEGPDGKGGKAMLGWGSLSAFHPRASYRFTAEISIYVAPEHARKGVGAALADEVLIRCKRLPVKTIVALIFGHNDPSLNLFKKKGFTLWGKLPRVADIDGIERDLDFYGLRIGP